MEPPRRGPAVASDRELDRLLVEHVKGVAVDAQTVRAHVIRPPHLDGAFSDRGSEGSKVQFAPRRPPIDVPHHLDVGAFGAALHEALKDNVAGYVAQLRQNGHAIFIKDWQFAKRSQDGSEGWTTDVQLHVASVSKLMTAIAMTLLLSEHNISPDAQIIDFLPDYWAKGPNIQFIVFRNLMNHTSGLTAVDVIDFDIMKRAIADGISLDRNATNHLGHYCYQNLNFGLCRILLAVINGNISKSAGVFFPGLLDPGLIDQLWDVATIASYNQYIQTNVFRPAGATGATLDHRDATGLAYEGPGDSARGWNSGNLENVSGAAGWHLSVDEVLAVMSEFRRGRSIVSPEAAQAMLDDGFGVDPFVNYQCGATAPPGLATPAGEIYCKNGRWHDGNGHEEQSLAYFLPQDMELVVLTNSPVGGGPNGTEQFFRDVVTQTYLNNLTTQPPVHL